MENDNEEQSVMPTRLDEGAVAVAEEETQVASEDEDSEPSDVEDDE